MGSQSQSHPTTLTSITLTVRQASMRDSSTWVMTATSALQLMPTISAPAALVSCSEQILFSTTAEQIRSGNLFIGKLPDLLSVYATISIRFNYRLFKNACV